MLEQGSLRENPHRATMREWWMYGLPEDCNPSLFDFATGALTPIGAVYAGAQ
jgi:hypothetical protein